MQWAVVCQSPTFFILEHSQNSNAGNDKGHSTFFHKIWGYQSYSKGLHGIRRVENISVKGRTYLKKRKA